MKKRIIPSILLNKGSNACLSRGFSPWRTIGALTQNLRLHVHRGADELLLINLDCAGAFGQLPSERVFSIVRNEVDIPIAYAGGVASIEGAISCINSGFDKVYLTSFFLDRPDQIQFIADVIGSQSLGICLPYQNINGQYFVWDYRSRQVMGLGLKDAFQMAISNGAGEILFYNSQADGSLEGLDLSLYRELELEEATVPILMAGGAGRPEHFSEALLQPKIQGVVAGSIFALTESTPLTIRQHCLDVGISMRRP